MSSTAAQTHSWWDLLELEGQPGEIDAFAFQSPTSDSLDEPDIYLHDTIPAPPPDCEEDMELDSN